MDQEPKSESVAENLTTLEHLPAELGFTETEQMRQIRQEMVQALRDDNWPQALRLKSEYDSLGSAAIEKMELDDRKNADLGLMIAIALIMKEVGKIDNYGADLMNAHLFAWNRGHNELAALLEKAINETGRQTLTSVPVAPKKEKKEFTDEYKTELQHLALELEARVPSVKVSMEQNHLKVNGQDLKISDGPAALWAALNTGRQVILRGMQSYSLSTPIRLMYLADYPRLVLAKETMERVDYPHNEKYFDEIDEIKEEFKIFWKAIEASGFAPEIRLFASKMGWYPVYLWVTRSEDQ